MPKKHHWICENKHLHNPFLVSTFLAKLTLVAALVIHALPLANIGANMFVADLDVSKLSYEEASRHVEDQFSQLQKQPVTLEFNEKEYTLELEALGADLNVYKTIENVYQSEYGNNLLDAGKHFLTSLIRETHVDPVFTIDEVQFENAIKSTIPDLKDPKNAEIIYNEDGKFEVIPHENGYVAKFESPKNNFLGNLKNFQTSTLRLQGELHEAAIQVDDAQEAAVRAQIYVEEPFTFIFDDNGEKKEYTVRFDRDWIDFETPDEGGVYSIIKRERLGQYIATKIAPQINIKNQDAILRALPEEGSTYSNVEGIARNGRRLLIDETLENFYAAVEQDKQSTDLVVQEVKGRILNQTGVNLGTLELLATGQSNYEGSPEGRDFNVRRGLNEKVNNVLLAPGDVYDFNKNLGPVTNSAGWKNSLAIFGGKDLIPVPGGGLCQVSTNVYRAALKAGLPIKERSNHSLYVHYYKPYGDGLDAAIFPGVKNLKFENDTPNYMLIQAYDDGFDGFVNIYGTPDGRSVELIGPFYPSGTFPKGQETIKEKISIRSNQIGWWQIIRNAAGDIIEEKQLTGTYRKVPRNL